MKAIVKRAVCPLLAEATAQSTVTDEVLAGMVVDILEEAAPGYFRIRTHYRYEGIVAGEDLVLDDGAARAWEGRPRQVVRSKNFCDVLSAPKVQGWHLASLTRGCLVSPVGEAEKGWQQVLLPDGRSGYVQASILGEYHTAPCCEDEEGLRRALAEAARLYVGTHYRWGGKSPMGIDCSGLVSMAYMLCGILIYRDAKIVEGFPIREIAMADMKPGDLMYFPGHVAMYLGDGRYIHSTGRSGDDGVTFNSLDPAAPDYRADLPGQITAVGTFF